MKPKYLHEAGSPQVSDVVLKGMLESLLVIMRGNFCHALMEFALLESVDLQIRNDQWGASVAILNGRGDKKSQGRRPKACWIDILAWVLTVYFPS